METIVAFVLGLIFGGIVGVLVMLVVKAKGSDGDAELRSKLEVVINRLEEAKRVCDEYKKDAEGQRAQADEGKIAIAKLQTEFEASQSRFEDMEHANMTLKDDLRQWQEQANKSRQKVAGLESQLESANGLIANFEQESVDLKEQIDAFLEQKTTVTTRNAELQAKLDASNKRLAEQTDIEKTLKAQFEVMANEVLAKNNDRFVKVADEKIGTVVKQANKDFSLSKDAVSELVKPLSDELKRIETTRAESQGNLTQQITALMENNTNLANEARNLSTALKRPNVRGSWGEMQLRRVVELAGMTNYCDYQEQVSTITEDGGRDRPDMVVRLPNDCTIVVDAKTPMGAYLTAVESDTEAERQDAIQQHARQVRERAQNLSQKSYQQLFERSPEFVVMFLPGEYLLSAALENDRELIDWAMQRNVIIATPNTLMALLKAVAMGWRETRIEQEAMKVAALGQELYDRLRIFAGHMVKMKGSLNATIENFNSGVGSLESRVLISARRFKNMGISTSQDIPELSEVNTQPREFRSAQLRALPEPSTQMTIDTSQACP